VKTPGFFGLDLALICEFASQEELAIDEYTLFNAVLPILIFIKRKPFNLIEFRCITGLWRNEEMGDSSSREFANC
jgi:hypothetical protein